MDPKQLMIVSEMVLFPDDNFFLLWNVNAKTSFCFIFCANEYENEGKAKSLVNSYLLLILNSQQAQTIINRKKMKSSFQKAVSRRANQ